MDKEMKYHKQVYTYNAMRLPNSVTFMGVNGNQYWLQVDMLQSSIDTTLKISAWKEAIMVLVEHVLIIPRDSAVKFIPSVMVQNISVTCMLRLVKTSYGYQKEWAMGC